jgi:hypothetical protein
MRKWIWEGFRNLYKGKKRTQAQVLKELVPFIESLTWDDLKNKTRAVEMPKETAEAIRNKVEEIEQSGEKTSIMAVLLSAVAKMREAEAISMSLPMIELDKRILEVD